MQPIPSPELRITRERIVYESSYGRLYDDDVRFESSGTVGTYLRWAWNSPFSVAVLPVHGNNVTLIRTFRHSARRLVLEAPKGFGVDGSSPADIARQELKEETGLVAGDLMPLYAVTVDPAFAYLPMYLFIAKNCVQGASSPELSESIVSVEVHDREQVLAELTSDHDPVDAATRLLLLESYRA
jgi:8-oxo-dGTP pyrophosphatase MutT (NUDIX family)